MPTAPQTTVLPSDVISTSVAQLSGEIAVG
jgi:hypothetical protein